MSKKSKTILTITLLLLLVLSFLSACKPANSVDNGSDQTGNTASNETSGNTDSGEAAGNAEEEQVSISFVTHDYEPTRPIHERWVAEYMELHPNVEINYVTYPMAELITKLITSYEAGRGDTVAGVYGPWLATLVSGGYLDPAPEAVAQDLQSDFYDFAQQGSMIDGVVYGVPRENGSPLPLLSVDVYEAAGVPESDYPTTYDELVALLPQLDKKNDDGSWDVQGICLPNNTFAVTNWITILKNYGVDLLNEDNTQAAFNTPEGVAATEMWKTLNYPDADHNLFPLMKCGMNWYGPWWRPAYQATYPVRVKVLAPFTGPAAQTHGNYTWQWVVNANASQSEKDAAWDFVQFISSKEKQIEIWTEGNIVPTRISVFEDPNLPDREFLLSFEQHFDKMFIFYPQIPQWLEIDTTLRPLLSRLRTGEITVDEFMQETEASINSILAED